MSSLSLSIEGIATQGDGTLKHDPIKFSDTTFHNYAEKIASDYSDIIKNVVLPKLKSANGLKLRDLRIISSIYFFDVPITPAQVAEVLRYDPATVSRSIRKLEAEGFILRSDNGKDKRSVRLHLTDAGTELGQNYTNAIRREFLNLENNLLYGLSDEEKSTFLNVMIKISRRAEAMKVLANL